MNIKVEHHGNPNGLSWFVTAAGIEAGPFTQVEALAEVAKIMARMGDLAKPKRPAWLYEGHAHCTRAHCVQEVITCPARRLADDGYAYYGPKGECLTGAARDQAQRDYAEMRRVTGTCDGDPVPAWY
jgi:hypothetical protein